MNLLRLRLRGWSYFILLFGSGSLNYILRDAFHLWCEKRRKNFIFDYLEVLGDDRGQLSGSFSEVWATSTLVGTWIGDHPKKLGAPQTSDANRMSCNGVGTQRNDHLRNLLSQNTAIEMKHFVYM